jgi:hypothetical protein
MDTRSVTRPTPLLCNAPYSPAFHQGGDRRGSPLRPGLGLTADRGQGRQASLPRRAGRGSDGHGQVGSQARGRGGVQSRENPTGLGTEARPRLFEDRGPQGRGVPPVPRDRMCARSLQERRGVGRGKRGSAVPPLQGILHCPQSPANSF